MKTIQFDRVIDALYNLIEIRNLSDSIETQSTEQKSAKIIESTCITKWKTS